MCAVYNVYDESIGGQCEPILLKVTKVIDCAGKL